MPKIFISYSHDSEEHREKVLSLSKRLHDDGMEIFLDQKINGSPPEGWPRWMHNYLRLHQVTIEHMDWAACVERYDRPHTLFYLDPPYYVTELYGVDFGLDQYDRMAELPRTM